MNYQLTIRRMAIEDVPKLKLDEQWMYERFRYCIENDIGPAWIISESGKALCAFGGLFEWGRSGACEVWLSFIERRRTLGITRLVKRLVTKLATEYNVTRMQAIVRCDSAVNNRFMRFLGFTNETPGGMRNKLYK